MPNVMGVLKAEISRIARKEAKALVAPVSKPVSGARRTFADLKRRVRALEKANRLLESAVKKMIAAQPQASAGEEADKARLTARGIRSLRKRLGLSQSQFAKIAEVSDQAVYLWESKTGALRMRPEVRAKILVVRGMGAREAKQKLEEMAAKAKAKAPKAPKCNVRKATSARRKVRKIKLTAGRRK